MRKIASKQEHDGVCNRGRQASRVWPLLSKVSKLKVSNRRNKREVRQLSEREREKDEEGWGG